MQCEAFEGLKHHFISVRDGRTKTLLAGRMTPQLEEHFENEELKALLRLLDHRAQHRCQMQGRPQFEGYLHMGLTSRT